MMAVFRIFLPNAFYGFSGFDKEVTPRSPAKTAIPRLEDCMTSLLVSLAAVIWVVTAVKRTMKS